MFRTLIRGFEATTGQVTFRIFFTTYKIKNILPKLSQSVNLWVKAVPKLYIRASLVSDLRIYRSKFPCFVLLIKKNV